MQMLVKGDMLNCGQCLKIHSQNEKKVPPCWYKECRNANYQFSGIDDWVMMTLSLKNSEIGKASAAKILELVDGNDLVTLEALIELDFAHNKALNEKAERERSLEKAHSKIK